MQQFGLPASAWLAFHFLSLIPSASAPPSLLLSLSLSALHSFVLSSEMRDLCGDLRATQK